MKESHKYIYLIFIPIYCYYIYIDDQLDQVELRGQQYFLHRQYILSFFKYF